MSQSPVCRGAATICVVGGPRRPSTNKELGFVNRPAHGVSYKHMLSEHPGRLIMQRGPCLGQKHNSDLGDAIGFVTC